MAIRTSMEPGLHAGHAVTPTRVRPVVRFHVAEARRRAGLAAVVAGAAVSGASSLAATVEAPMPVLATVAAIVGAVLGWACDSPDPSTPAGRAERALRAVGGGVAVGLASRSGVAGLAVAGLLLAVAARRAHPAEAVIDLRDGHDHDRRADADVALALEGLPACRAIKRALDVTIAAVALVLTLPVLLVAAMAIRLDSSGGILYRQVRMGRGGRVFEVLKLRTMTADNDDGDHLRYVASLIRGEDAGQGFFKITGDRRVTRVGRVLRRFSIDELPQLLNVLRGDMSLVGPRPALPIEVAMYDADAWYRLACAPGMTGLWQVSGRSRLSFADMVRLDREYVARWTPVLDLLILARTPRAVLAQETA